MTLGGKSCRLQPSASPGLLTPAPLTSRSGLGPWEIAARARPPARGLQGAPGLTARPRTGLAARSRSASSSLGTAGDPRADAQTDRRRGAGRSPAAPGSANQRRGGRTPLTLLPCSARRGALSAARTSQLTWPPSPMASWGPFLGHWSGFTLRLFALSRGLSPAQGLRKIVCKIAYLSAVFSFFLGAEEVHFKNLLLSGIHIPPKVKNHLAPPGAPGLILDARWNILDFVFSYIYLQNQLAVKESTRVLARARTHTHLKNVSSKSLKGN